MPPVAVSPVSKFCRLTYTVLFLPSGSTKVFMRFYKNNGYIEKIIEIQLIFHFQRNIIFFQVQFSFCKDRWMVNALFSTETWTFFNNQKHRFVWISLSKQKVTHSETKTYTKRARPLISSCFPLKALFFLLHWYSWFVFFFVFQKTSPFIYVLFSFLFYS